ncbi:MAG: hypothetical protein EOP61_37970 [Sphingomonadales bacterium]|nr:MAG: hypothetical protein EOP61_37970 [Sphingomonadales bacterium]
MIGVRYRELLGNSSASGREVLITGQRSWEAQRIGCNAQEEPLPCRMEANVRRLTSLDIYAIGGRS